MIHLLVTLAPALKIKGNAQQWGPGCIRGRLVLDRLKSWYTLVDFLLLEDFFAEEYLSEKKKKYYTWRDNSTGSSYWLRTSFLHCIYFSHEKQSNGFFYRTKASLIFFSLLSPILRNFFFFTNNISENGMHLITDDISDLMTYNMW